MAAMLLRYFLIVVLLIGLSACDTGPADLLPAGCDPARTASVEYRESDDTYIVRDRQGEDLKARAGEVVCWEPYPDHFVSFEFDSLPFEEGGQGRVEIPPDAPPLERTLLENVAPGSYPYVMGVRRVGTDTWIPVESPREWEYPGGNRGSTASDPPADIRPRIIVH